MIGVTSAGVVGWLLHEPSPKCRRATVAIREADAVGALDVVGIRLQHVARSELGFESGQFAKRPTIQRQFEVRSSGSARFR